MSQKDIFSIGNFIVKKTKTGIETKINHFNMIVTFLKGCPTFGESTNLRKLIKRSITPEELGDLNEQNKKIDINFYFAPRLLTNNPFFFNPKQMTK